MNQNRGLWRKLWAIAKPYWFSNEKKVALGLLAILILLLVGVNVLNIAINFVAGSYMTALQEKNAPVYYHYLYIYAGVFIVGTPIVVLYSWMQDKLRIHWRRWLTHHLLDKYFKNRAFYRINNDKSIDNPDERLAQDVDAFTRTALNFLLIILGSIITFFSFITILWSISHLLVYLCFGYTAVGTVVTVFMGKRLVPLNYNQLRTEADFRYGLIHVRKNVESIAFFRGEEQEKAQIKQRFVEVFKNFNLLIGWTRNLNFWQTGFNYFIIILPALIIAPLYFAGKVQLGAFTQADLAFGQVLGSVAIVVTAFNDIASFTAIIARLGGFAEALDAPAHKPGEPVIASSEEPRVALEKVTLETPHYERTLVADLTASVAAGEGLLIIGPSGTGKSSLLRAIAGLWDSGSGRIVRPKLEDIMFLPQRPYMVLGSLREQLTYPQTNATATDEQLQKVLDRVNLSDLPARVGGFDVELNFADVLSLGEQQRLAFARLLVSEPKYAILDEATSALDVGNEEHLYKELQATRTTFISVGHRPTLVKYHQNVLELKGDKTWKLYPAPEKLGGC